MPLVENLWPLRSSGQQGEYKRYIMTGALHKTLYRNGLLYVIQLLISHNADPTLMDVQGYNSLHLVTHSSNVMPLLYMLQQPVAADSVDAQGHTSLMWACYQGDSISADILLKHSASITARDSAGLTPLHWAVVRGNRFCIKLLIESGADLHAKDDSGKTPHDLAVELKSVEAYRAALEEAGYTDVGSRKVPLLNDVSMCRIFSKIISLRAYFALDSETRSWLFSHCPSFSFMGFSKPSLYCRGIRVYLLRQRSSLGCTMCVQIRSLS